jgi:CRISPR/Cas system CMR-associated protein Cmr5 small subunit
MKNTLPKIQLPLMPENYYGSRSSIENLILGESIYVGPSATCEEMVVKEIAYNDSGHYEIYTDKAILIADRNTRVATKGYYE